MQSLLAHDHLAYNRTVLLYPLSFQYPHTTANSIKPLAVKKRDTIFVLGMPLGYLSGQPVDASFHLSCSFMDN